MATVLCLDGERGHIRKLTLTDREGLLAQTGPVWIDAQGNEPGLTEFMRDELKLHPLAVEDIFESQQLPKIEDYGDYLYIVAHAVARSDSEGPFDFELVEIDLVLTPKWVFSHHNGPFQAAGELVRELERNPRAIERGPAFVAHALLDRLVDEYLPVIDAVDEEVDAIETAVIERPTPEVLERLFRLKRILQRLRRTAVHQRELLQRLARGEFEVIPEKSLPFFRDIYDQFLRISDLADSYRELLSNALDAYLSVVSNRMNEVMKTLTIVATLMMPMTFIVGVYGMNFVHMPELHWRYGYAYVWVLLIAVFVGMLGWFRYRRWL
ncbi:MAG TPA: magnesium/cobalt transporter CorA [Polyangiaceae bacterium]|nr:magnesium/cobalt transporter CorA [Polyangiaceae bacterium]